MTDIKVRLEVCPPWREVFGATVVYSQPHDPEQHAGLLPHEPRAPLEWATEQRVTERFGERNHQPGVRLGEDVREPPGPEFFERLYREATERRDREAKAGTSP